MAKPWEWLDRSSVRIGGKEFAFAPTKEREANEFALLMHRAYTKRGVLLSARQSFENADVKTFENACERLDHLISELDRSAVEAVRVARDIEAFFQPSGVVGALPQDFEALLSFALDAAEKLTEPAPTAAPPVPPTPEPSKV